MNEAPTAINTQTRFNPQAENGPRLPQRRFFFVFGRLNLWFRFSFYFEIRIALFVCFWL